MTRGIFQLSPSPPPFKAFDPSEVIDLDTLHIDSSPIKDISTKREDPSKKQNSLETRAYIQVQTSSPTTKGNDVSATKRNDVSATKKNDVSATKRNDVSAPKRNDLSATKGNDASATKGNDAPATKENDVPATTGSDVPAAKRKNPPAEIKEQGAKRSRIRPRPRPSVLDGIRAPEVREGRTSVEGAMETDGFSKKSSPPINPTSSLTPSEDAPLHIDSSPKKDISPKREKLSKRQNSHETRAYIQVQSSSPTTKGNDTSATKRNDVSATKGNVVPATKGNVVTATKGNDVSATKRKDPPAEIKEQGAKRSRIRPRPRPSVLDGIRTPEVREGRTLVEGAMEAYGFLSKKPGTPLNPTSSLTPLEDARFSKKPSTSVNPTNSLTPRKDVPFSRKPSPPVNPTSSLTPLEDVAREDGEISSAIDSDHDDRVPTKRSTTKKFSKFADPAAARRKLQMSSSQEQQEGSSKKTNKEQKKRGRPPKAAKSAAHSDDLYDDMYLLPPGKPVGTKKKLSKQSVLDKSSKKELKKSLGKGNLVILSSSEEEN